MTFKEKVKEEWKKDKLSFICNNILGLNSIFEIGKYLFILILCYIVINNWIIFCLTHSSFKYISILYSITFLIPLIISTYNLKEIFNE